MDGQDDDDEHDRPVEKIGAKKAAKLAAKAEKAEMRKAMEMQRDDAKQREVTGPKSGHLDFDFDLVFRIFRISPPIPAVMFSAPGCRPPPFFFPLSLSSSPPPRCTVIRPIR